MPASEHDEDRPGPQADETSEADEAALQDPDSPAIGVLDDEDPAPPEPSEPG